MPYTKIAAVIITLVCLSAAHARADIASDKQKHLIAGAAIYGVCVGFGALTRIDWINYKTCLIPTAATAVGKEIYDIDHDGNPDAEDAAVTMAVPLLAAGVTFTLLEW